MKQTAVEWYTDALKQWDLCYMESNGKISKDVYESTKISLQEKAKAMEKRQELKMPDYNLDDLANFYSTSTLFIKNKELPTQQQIEDAEHISEISFKAGFQKAIELLTFKSE